MASNTACRPQIERDYKMIKNIIANFISDERGVESMEFGVGGIIVAGGAVKGLSDTKEIIQDKNQAMLDKIGESSID
jgi:Flp pilus assembly pilin Flp